MTVAEKLAKEPGQTQGKRWKEMERGARVCFTPKEKPLASPADAPVLGARQTTSTSVTTYMVLCQHDEILEGLTSGSAHP